MNTTVENNNNDGHEHVTHMSSSPRHAVLFGDFPPDYTRKLISKLRERNVVVDVVYSPTVRKGVQDSIERADFVLLTEISGHKDGIFIREIAKQTGKNVVFLPRKVSQWGNLTSPRNAEGKVISSRPSSRAVSDENIEPFAKEYVTLAEQGLSHRDMVPKLQKLWQGTLATPQQLGVFLHFLLLQERCPEWFKGWWLKHRGSLPVKPQKVSTVEPEIVKEDDIVTESTSISIETTHNENDLRELAQMYSRDAANLRERQRKFKTKLASILYVLIEEKNMPLADLKNLIDSDEKTFEGKNQHLLAYVQELADNVISS
jgi:hypothetical protein